MGAVDEAPGLWLSAHSDSSIASAGASLDASFDAASGAHALKLGAADGNLDAASSSADASFTAVANGITGGLDQRLDGLNRSLDASVESANRLADAGVAGADMGGQKVPATKSGGVGRSAGSPDTATGWYRWLAWISCSTGAEVAAVKAVAPARKTAAFQ